MPPTTDRLSDVLALLDPQDLEMLRHRSAHDLTGTILELNRTPRYHNSLDAIRLVHRLIAERSPVVPASSPVLPAPSGTKPEEGSSDTNFVPVKP
ncbi:MAG TPA: hypothetical protein VGE21_02490 [Flavobacteriales bacterium]